MEYSLHNSNFEKLPTELLIHIFTFLDVDDVYKTIVYISKAIFETCENYHYWKISSEEYFKYYFHPYDFSLPELNEKLGSWKNVYHFLRENDVHFVEESLNKRKFKGEVSSNRKTFSLAETPQDGNPTIFFDREINRNEILAISIKIERDTDTLKRHLKDSNWLYIGVCEEKNYDLIREGNWWLANLRISTSHFIKGKRFGTVITMKIDTSRGAIFIYEDGLQMTDHSIRHLRSYPLRACISYPVFLGQVVNIVRNPEDIKV